MIDEEKTFKLFGYYSIDLKPQSMKKVVAVCDMGGEVRILRMCSYRDLCRSCSQKKRYEDPLERELQSERVKKRFEDPIEREKQSIKTKQSKIFKDPIKSKIRSEKISIGLKKYYKILENRILASCRKLGISREDWTGFTPSQKSGYCNLFNLPLKETVRLYFDDKCFMDNEPEENGKALCVHHVNYDKRCGCNATQFCIFIPVKAKWNKFFNGCKKYNRWYWYSFLMNKIFIEHPNYFTYHIPVWGMNELEYDYSYVFEKFRRK